MKKIFLFALLTLFFMGCATQDAKEPSRTTPKAYQCVTDADCVSTCGMGCVNTAFAATYEDTCVNFRAFDCSCVQNECYTDGRPFSNSP